MLAALALRKKKDSREQSLERCYKLDLFNICLEVWITEWQYKENTLRQLGSSFDPKVRVNRMVTGIKCTRSGDNATVTAECLWING